MAPPPAASTPPDKRTSDRLPICESSNGLTELEGSAFNLKNLLLRTLVLFSSDNSPHVWIPLGILKISSHTGADAVTSRVPEKTVSLELPLLTLTATLLPAAPSGTAVIGPHPHNVPVAFVPAPPAPPAAVPSDPPVRLTVPKSLCADTSALAGSTPKTTQSLLTSSPNFLTRWRCWTTPSTDVRISATSAE